MARYALAVDISRCDGCGSCFLACKDEYVGNDHLPLAAAQPEHGHKWIRLSEVEQGEGNKIKMDYIPIMCQHCENPPCKSGAPDGAITTRPDGIVVLDSMKAKGCREMVGKCPYNAIFWNEQRDIPQKCNLCAHMLDSGEMTTRCAESCPTQALKFGDLDDPSSDISQYLAEKGDYTVLRPEFDTAPRTRYRELPAPFITGEVLLSDRTAECCEGAFVTCTGPDGKSVETSTDFMGDFQFKGLEQGGRYTVTVSYPGYKPYSRELLIYAAKDLGLITLEK